MLLDQLSLRGLRLFEKGNLAEVREMREEENGVGLKAKEETVAVAEAKAAMLRVFV